MNKDDVQRLLDKAPSDWRAQFSHVIKKGEKPTVDVVLRALQFTAGGNPSGEPLRGPHTVPDAVKRDAAKGLLLSWHNNYGAWNFIGVARAIQLVVMPGVSDVTLSRMRAYFSRHRNDKRSSNFGNDNNPSRGYMAWLNWGGDAADNWLNATKAKKTTNSTKMTNMAKFNSNLNGLAPAYANPNHSNMDSSNMDSKSTEYNNMKPLASSASTGINSTGINTVYCEALTVLIERLRALKWLAWNAHWMASGPTSYSDHLLFERIYDSIDKHVDTVAENLFGSSPNLAKAAWTLGVQSNVTDHLTSLLRTKNQRVGVADVVAAVKSVHAACQDVVNLKANLAAEDFAPNIAKKMETYLYLLQQRSL